MKNTARQPIVSISTPPTSGPPDSAAAAPAAHQPIARARSAGAANAWLRRISEHGTRTAAPKPWIARAAISAPMLGARPHAADAVVKSAKPATKTRRAPIRSPSAPAERMNAAKAIV